MANSCPDGRWVAGDVPALLLARRVEREARGGACFCPFRSEAVGRRRGRQEGPKAVSEARKEQMHHQRSHLRESVREQRRAQSPTATSRVKRVPGHSSISSPVTRQATDVLANREV